MKTYWLYEKEDDRSLNSGSTDQVPPDISGLLVTDV